VRVRIDSPGSTVARDKSITVHRRIGVLGRADADDFVVLNNNRLNPARSRQF